VKATTNELATCAHLVEELFNPLISQLWRSGRAIAPLFNQPASSADLLAESQPHAFEILAAPHTVGAGFVVTPGILTDEHFLLAWWQGDDKERIPESIALVQSTDYSRQEWFRTPQRTHASHVTGPYIDYVCTDEFMLTITVPVEQDGQMLGVMGADILAETIERVLLEPFQEAGATLVNHHNRAVLSAEVEIFAGEPINPENFSQEVPCADLPLKVIN